MDESLRPQRSVVTRPAHLLLLAAGLLAAGAVRAQTPPLPRGAEAAPEALRPLLGAWDVELVGAPRKCTVTLGAEPAARGRQLRFPATCRRALPILDQVVGWSAAEDGAPRFEDSAGKPVVAFTKAAAGFDGKGTDGKQYLLDPKGYPRSAPRAQPSSAERAATAAARLTTVDPASAPAAETVPGRYAMMRQQNREACAITLAAGPLNSTGRAPASFDGRCDDTGLTIFDPVGWRYAAGRLSLIARKGHSVELVFESGQWRKDPAVGAPLLLRKRAP
jgi:hypothetical protein